MKIKTHLSSSGPWLRDPPEVGYFSIDETSVVSRTYVHCRYGFRCLRIASISCINLYKQNIYIATSWNFDCFKNNFSQFKSLLLPTRGRYSKFNLYKENTPNMHIDKYNICILINTRFKLQSDHPRGRFKNTYELLNLRYLTFAPVNRIYIFQCTGKMFCVELQRVPLEFHTEYLTHTLKDTFFIQRWNFKSS